MRIPVVLDAVHDAGKMVITRPLNDPNAERVGVIGQEDATERPRRNGRERRDTGDQPDANAPIPTDAPLTFAVAPSWRLRRRIGLDNEVLGGNQIGRAIRNSERYRSDRKEPVNTTPMRTQKSPGDRADRSKAKPPSSNATKHRTRSGFTSRLSRIVIEKSDPAPVTVTANASNVAVFGLCAMAHHLPARERTATQATHRPTAAPASHRRGAQMLVCKLGVRAQIQDRVC